MSSFTFTSNGCFNHTFSAQPESCADCIRVMAADAEKAIDLAIMVENEADFANPIESPTTDLFAAAPTFEYPPPPTTDLEDKIAAELQTYHTPFPVITDEGYNPESLALEPYEQFPKYCAPHPLYKDESYYPESLALEEYEGGPRRPGRPRVHPSASRAHRNDRKAKKLGRRATKEVSLRQLKTKQMIGDEVPEDTIVVDVGEATEEFDQPRKASARSKAKLSLAKKKTALLNELKEAEDEPNLEEEKAARFAFPAEETRKRKAVSESEDSPKPRRRAARATRGSVNYAE